MNENQHIVVADDHPLFRKALRYTLATHLPNSVISEFDSLHDLTAQADLLEQADLLLLDLNMPGAHGFSGLIFVCGRYASLPVIVISANEDIAVMHQAIRYGAAGFVPKSAPPEELATALSSVLAGNIYLPKIAQVDLPPEPSKEDLANKISSLTPHQYRVFSLMREGLLNKQIAYELGVSEATVKAHITPILRKLGVNNRTQAVLLGDQFSVSEQQSTFGMGDLQNSA